MCDATLDDLSAGLMQKEKPTPRILITIWMSAMRDVAHLTRFLLGVFLGGGGCKLNKVLSVQKRNELLCVLRLPKEEPPWSRRDSANKRKAFWELAQKFSVQREKGLDMNVIGIWINIRLMSGKYPFCPYFLQCCCSYFLIRMCTRALCALTICGLQVKGFRVLCPDNIIVMPLRRKEPGCQSPLRKFKSVKFPPSLLLKTCHWSVTSEQKWVIFMLFQPQKDTTYVEITYLFFLL